MTTGRGLVRLNPTESALAKVKGIQEKKMQIKAVEEQSRLEEIKKDAERKIATRFLTCCDQYLDISQEELSSFDEKELLPLAELIHDKTKYQAILKSVAVYGRTPLGVLAFLGLLASVGGGLAIGSGFAILIGLPTSFGLAWISEKFGVWRESPKLDLAYDFQKNRKFLIQNRGRLYLPIEELKKLLVSDDLIVTAVDDNAKMLDQVSLEQERREERERLRKIKKDNIKIISKLKSPYKERYRSAKKLGFERQAEIARIEGMTGTKFMDLEEKKNLIWREADLRLGYSIGKKNYVPTSSSRCSLVQDYHRKIDQCVLNKYGKVKHFFDKAMIIYIDYSTDAVMYGVKYWHGRDLHFFIGMWK